MTTFKQSLFLLLSFAFVALWEITVLSAYTLPLMGFLIFLYIVLSARGNRMGKHLENGGDKTVLILNTAILLFIFSTDGIHSPLFFLLYFVLFGIAFVFEPLVVFVYVLATTALFGYQLLQGDIMNNVISIASLYLIAPLAFFFGKEYKKHTTQEEKIEEIIEDPATPPAEKEKLEHVLEDEK